MLLTIIIPCFNELHTIKTLLNSLIKIDFINTEIIIIDDCSTDGTFNLLFELNALYNFKLFKNDKNRGKGFCIKAGIKYATGDLILIQDADLEYDPLDIKKLLNPIFVFNADVVYGSRFKGGDAGRVLFFWHMIGNKFLTLLSNLFTNLNLTDMETCYKLFKSEIIKNINLNENRFGFEPEVTAKISKLNLKIYEIGISYNGRNYSEGKKINWKDGFRAIYCIIRYNIF